MRGLTCGAGVRGDDREGTQGTEPCREASRWGYKTTGTEGGFLRHYFLGRDADRTPEPDLTVPIDDMLTRRLQACLCCGAQPELLHYNVWLRLSTPPLALAYSVCLPCLRGDPEGVAVDEFLTARYQHL